MAKKTFQQEVENAGFKMWYQPQDKELNTSEIIKMYENGFVGSICSEEAEEELLDTLEMPYGSDVARKYGFEDIGKDQLVFPLQHVMKAYPNSFPGKAQVRGSCVADSAALAARSTMVLEAILGLPDEITGLLEEIPKVSLLGEKNNVVAFEPLYWFRGHGSDGWSCSSVVKVLTSQCGVILRRDYPEFGINLEEYSGNLAGKWGRTPPPQEVTKYLNKNLFRTATKVSSFEEVRDFLAKGFFIVTCGSQGWSETRDENGFSKRQGTWQHALLASGTDDRSKIKAKYGEPLVHVNNTWGCYSDDTEVLTSNGWKYFSEVDINKDFICTLNPKNHSIEYHEASAYHEYDYDGELYNFKLRGIDQLVTPNHNMYFGKLHSDTNDTNSWSMTTANKLIGKHIHFKKDGKWKGINPEYKYIGEYKIPIKDWCEFLGLFISEGHTTFKENGWFSNKEKAFIKCHPSYTVGISMEKSHDVEEAQKVIDKMPFSILKQKGGWVITNNKPLYMELRSLGKAHEKSIPQEIKNLTPELLSAFFKYAMLGDGCFRVTKTGPQETYYTSSKKLADDIQEICLKIGICADIRTINRIGRDNGSGGITRHIEYQLPIKRTSLTPRKNGKGGIKPEKVKYNGKVYCLTVHNHIMYIRRNGKASWSGNSYNKDKEGPRKIMDSNLYIPDGSFWAKWSDFKNRDMYAISGLSGWARKELPNLEPDFI